MNAPTRDAGQKPETSPRAPQSEGFNVGYQRLGEHWKGPETDHEGSCSCFLEGVGGQEVQESPETTEDYTATYAPGRAIQSKRGPMLHGLSAVSRSPRACTLLTQKWWLDLVSPSDCHRDTSYYQWPLPLHSVARSLGDAQKEKWCESVSRWRIVAWDRGPPTFRVQRGSGPSVSLNTNLLNALAERLCTEGKYEKSHLVLVAVLLFPLSESSHPPGLYHSLFLFLFLPCASPILLLLFFFSLPSSC